MVGSALKRRETASRRYRVRHNGWDQKPVGYGGRVYTADVEYTNTERVHLVCEVNERMMVASPKKIGGSSV